MRNTFAIKQGKMVKDHLEGKYHPQSMLESFLLFCPMTDEIRLFQPVLFRNG